MSISFSVASAVGFWTKSKAPASSAASTCAPCSAAMLMRTMAIGRPGHLRAHEGQAVHHGHVQIAGHDVGPQLLDALERVGAVAGRADDLDERTSRQHLGDDLADVGRVVDDQDANNVRQSSASPDASPVTV